MLRIDPQVAALASPLWIAAGSAALLVVVIGAPTPSWSRRSVVARALRLPLVVLAAALAGSLTWALVQGAAERDRSAERRALEARAGALAAKALAPRSPLACLDVLAGNTVQAACESAVFASPVTVAAAVSYVAAQFALLSDMASYARHGGTGIDETSLPLRRALEADPFGLLAHVLVERDRCSSGNCPPLALLRDASHVRTNIIAQTLDHYVDHYRQAWAAAPESPAAEVTGVTPGAAAELSGGGKRKLSVKIDFPTAESIPPVSIMNPEPKSAASAEPVRKRTGTAETDPVWTPAPAQPAH
jgi:hypothetical protein